MKTILRRRQLIFLSWVMPWLVLLTGTLVSLLVAREFSQEDQLRAQQDFLHRADLLQHRASEQADVLERLLYSTRGAFYSSESLQRDEFREFIDEANLERNYPGAPTVSFIRYLPRNQLKQFLRQTRADGAPDFSIRPLGTMTRPDLMVVEYTAPKNSSGSSEGVDFGTDPARRSLLESAMTSGLPRLAPLMQPAQVESGPPEMLLALPVYLDRTTPPSQAARRKALTGWISVPLQFQPFMADIIRVEDGIDVDIIDNTDGKTTLLYDFDGVNRLSEASRSDYQRRLFKTTYFMEFGGRALTLEMSSLPGLEAMHSIQRSGLVLFGGIALAILMAILTWMLRKVGISSATQAKVASQSLDEREKYFQAIFSSTVDGFIVIDAHGSIEAFNPAAEKIFGYQASEVVGQNVNSLMPSPHREQHDQYLANFLIGGAPKVIGISRDVTGLRKDGSSVPIRLAVNALYAKGKIHFVGMVHDISEQKNLEEMLRMNAEKLEKMVEEQTADLRAAKEAAESASSAKSAFFASMSHELRTPLHAINSFADLGREKIGSVPAEKLEQYFSKIRSAGQRMLEMVSDLLDLSKLEAGKMPFNFHEQDLLQVAQEIVGELQVMASSRNVFIMLESPRVPTTLLCDAQRVGQVLLNLLANAIRFSPKDGIITVVFGATELPGRRLQDAWQPALSVSVSDQGPGIAAGELETIFDEFVQSKHVKSGEGTGLGLAICRRIINAHLGRIWAENLAEGGARLTFVLPYHPSLPQEGR